LITIAWTAENAAKFLLPVQAGSRNAAPAAVPTLGNFFQPTPQCLGLLRTGCPDPGTRLAADPRQAKAIVLGRVVVVADK